MPHNSFGAQGSLEVGGRSTSVAPEVRRRLLPSRDRFWHPEDFAGSPDAVAQALSRLARAGVLWPAAQAPALPGGAQPLRSACRRRCRGARRSPCQAEHRGTMARSTSSAAPPARSAAMSGYVVNGLPITNSGRSLQDEFALALALS